MKQNHIQQKGDAHAVIIIVLVVALIGTLGFIFWQNFTKASEQAAQDADAKQTENKKTETDESRLADTDNSEKKTKVADEGYFAVPDWGVQFKKLENDEVQWRLRDSTSLGLTTKAIFDLGHACAGEMQYQVVVIRSTEDLKQEIESFSLNTYAYVGKVGDFHYAYAGSHAACVDASLSVQ